MKEEFNSVLGGENTDQAPKKKKKKEEEETWGILRGTNYFLFFLNSI